MLPVPHHKRTSVSYCARAAPLSPQEGNTPSHRHLLTTTCTRLQQLVPARRRTSRSQLPQTRTRNIKLGTLEMGSDHWFCGDILQQQEHKTKPKAKLSSIKFVDPYAPSLGAFPPSLRFPPMLPHPLYRAAYKVPRWLPHHKPQPGANMGRTTVHHGWYHLGWG
ncbi:hypothetical protein E2C01_017503 [Portunus trituberculatus]|uniref:Uncharacterized protein n=1 Tax=Portunus trituberculatus TaxID=210409 RepID=A0A5B7DRW7_PORTR|nr:hypothetical protein [Portunus trituberculatus]